MGAVKKNLKATKKFEKRHLKGVLDKRKDGAKIKQRMQLQDKKKARRAKDAEFLQGSEGKEGVRAKASKTNKVSEMSVDDFFQNGFEEIIDKTKQSKRKRDGAEDKGAEDEDEDSGSDVLMEDQQFASDSEDDEGDADRGMSKKAMDALASKDPEFYQFLKENDPEALDFDENADLAEVDELSAGEEDGEEQPEEAKKKKKKSKKTESDAESRILTREMVAKWKQAMTERQSLRAARQVVLAFRSAAHLNETDEDGVTDQRWVIDSPEVFNDVVVVALREMPAVLNHYLPIKESAAGKVYVATETHKFRTLSTLLKSYTASMMHLLSTLSDDKTLKLTLSSMTPLLPYLLSFKKLVKALAKTVVGFWAQPASSESTRMTAFLVLRRLVVIGDKGIRETTLRAVYAGLVQGSRVTNAATAAGINLMKNSAAELWGIDASVGYTTAFALIRQLAMHLRNSIVHNKNESFRMVYNWQFTHSLDFWSCVLAQHCSQNNTQHHQQKEKSQLWLLIYPLVQVTLGAMRLIPTAAYFPLRFLLVRSLLRISRASGTYIPLASPLLEVLASAEMKNPPRNSTLKPLDFALAYKAPKSYLRTRIYQDGVGEQLVELLAEFMLLWATSVAFPELALPVVVQLKRWLKAARSAKGIRNAKLVSQLVLLVQKVEANAGFIQEKRAHVDFAPKDRAQVDAFLRDFDVAKTPLGAFVVAQRVARAERAKVLDEARREEERKRKEDGKAAPVDDDDDDEDDDDDDAEESDEDMHLGDQDQDQEEDDE